MKIFRNIFFRKKPLIRHKSSSAQNPQAYCIDLVKKYDFENYLCTINLRSKDQPSAFAVRAFNVEVANVATQVSTATTGQMRYKFWEDSIDRIFNDNPPHHPVAQELHRALEKNAFNRRNLRQLLETRAIKLSLTTFQSMDEMEKYAESTCSPVFYILLSSCGIENVQADHAFSHLGKAQGLTNLIRSVPYYAQRRVVIFPQDVLAKHKVSHESIIRGGHDKPARDVAFDVACRAHSHVDKVLSLIEKVPKKLHRHFLPITPLKCYLERLRLVDFDVFHPSLQSRDNTLALKLLWRTLTGKF